MRTVLATLPLALALTACMTPYGDPYGQSGYPRALSAGPGLPQEPYPPQGYSAAGPYPPQALSAAGYRRRLSGAGARAGRLSGARGPSPSGT